ncbi:hypothetical protein [Helicobacter pullorum]|uniref:Uncharacterized protein n=1 Tax=Helicobacter pullorum TaxID=35818 RepID=A0A0N1E8H0_9HELI|nr:hypothetical protein [Helicobacter pullorum]EAI5592869.1 hypothetical protein [Campylobacter jejuni]HEH5010491.1 hypothetical protein [Campylobacter coli]EAL0720616.1 hypothetical protein [Campylobacter jejuni]KPH55504.1 hypothetical protein HPU229334_08115 [Helicobacter pullorum]OCR09704.1 hypothetical protein A7X13_04145 [Helicobacter pullorum]
MSGFIGINELFIKLELKTSITLSQLDKEAIRKALYPLSKKNRLTLQEEDYKEAVSVLQIQPEQEVKKFLVAYLKKNIQDMI